MSAKYVILVPQFNDWEALNLLIERINSDLARPILSQTSLLVVDDCSSVEPPAVFTRFEGLALHVLRLHRNLGHQRAIAIGLSYLANETTDSHVIVMDADGEDAPRDINKLVEASTLSPKKIIVAHRTKRHEGVLFQGFYFIYKILFKLLTGKVITFGNFSLVPRSRLGNIVRVSEIWNNYPGGIIRSRIPYEAVPIERGRRLAGESKMNFVSLVLHGLSAVSVLVDATAVRIFIFTIWMSGLSAVFIGVVLFLKLIGNATPGWASTLGAELLIVMLQSLLISLFLVFMVLQYRTQQHFIPAIHYRDFVDTIDTPEQR